MLRLFFCTESSAALISGKPPALPRICSHCRPKLGSHLEEAEMRSFLTGLGVGIGLGILFAPMSGEETRSNLTDRANNLAESAREGFDQGRERIRTGMNAIRGGAGSTGSGSATGTENM
jgi:hypothetical protein